MKRLPSFFSIKNFSRFQHYKKRKPSWIKLYYDLLDDEDYISMTVASQHHYMTLLMIAGCKDNRIPCDPEYLRKVMRLSTIPDLRELFIKGFLLASRKHHASILLAPCKQNAMSETETETETETEGDNGCTELAVEVKQPPPPPRIRETAKRRIKTDIPEQFTFDRPLEDMAKGLGLVVSVEVAKFKDKAKALGWQYIDWTAAFRNWMRKEYHWKKERERQR